MKTREKNIVLTGFRATGKTSVGRLLAKRLGYAFLDTDALLCQRLGATVAETVARHGWDYFRAAERSLLEEIPALTRTVIATGGGAIGHEEAWQGLRSSCWIVWLEADPATIRQRIEGDGASAGQRPSLTGADIRDEISVLLEARMPLYAAGSDFRTSTVGRSTKSLVEWIINAVAGRERTGGEDPGTTVRRTADGGCGKEVDSANGNRDIGSIWMVTREYEGLAGAGGVKDVCRQLAETLAGRGGYPVRVILPRYGFMQAAKLGFSRAAIGSAAGRIWGHRFDHVFEVDMHYADEERRETVAIWQAELNGVTVFLIEADRYAAKRGVYTYTEEDEVEVAWQRRGGGHFDYFAMNILLQRTALDLMILLDEHPGVIHCQDGHAATLPAMMRENSGYRHYFRGTGTVVTIHNAGVGYHQEVGDLEFVRAITGLPQRAILKGRLGGSFDPFVSAAEYAVINTVSENYGRELQETQEDARTGWLGHALLEHGVRLAGITNGIDPEAFNPTRPESLGLAAGFDIAAGEMQGKVRCKQTLLARIAEQRAWAEVRQYGCLDDDAEAPLCTFIGRLTAQKGVDILIKAIGELLAGDPGCRFLVFGSGTPEYERELELLSESESGQGRVCYLKGYDPMLANKVYAAGDFFLIPSRYEPCGLTDYIAQLLGNLPIVHRVGGLVKVKDNETGFCYDDNSPSALAAAVAAALRVYRQEPHRIRSMQQAAMATILRYHTWEKVMEEYLRLYRQALRSIGRRG